MNTTFVVLVLLITAIFSAMSFANLEGQPFSGWIQFTVKKPPYYAVNLWGPENTIKVERLKSDYVTMHVIDGSIVKTVKVPDGADRMDISNVCDFTTESISIDDTGLVKIATAGVCSFPKVTFPRNIFKYSIQIFHSDTLTRDWKSVILDAWKPNGAIKIKELNIKQMFIIRRYLFRGSDIFRIELEIPDNFGVEIPGIAEINDVQTGKNSLNEEFINITVLSFSELYESNVIFI